MHIALLSARHRRRKEKVSCTVVNDSITDARLAQELDGITQRGRPCNP